MASSKKPIVKVQEENRVAQEDQPAKVIEWEDYEQELARLCSLTSALEEAKTNKLGLEEKLQSSIQIESESLSRSNELDQMREKLEHRKLLMGKMSMRSKVVKEKVRKQEKQLSGEIRSLLVGGSSISVANKRMQAVWWMRRPILEAFLLNSDLSGVTAIDAFPPILLSVCDIETNSDVRSRNGEDSSRLLAGEKGYGHLKILQKSLRLRQQYMTTQVTLLYPVKVVVRKSSEQELESFRSSIKSGVPDGSKPLDQGTLTISGLHLTVVTFTKMSFFTNKKEVQRSSTALGYVAHAVSLISSYLQVPLRYPLRLGGSRSFIRDYSPSVELSASSTSLDTVISTSSKPVEFPLFIEGQDSTRAAYAIFLLNKDLEQVLNFIGVKSVGPRHILANLKELTLTVLSQEYIDM
ncbi:hypothetical protein SASPL_145436 [Salvia splendens]|uniref:Uncharacterized protein n=1 Tax=Salvia splendens TaxID=180675 RepID=A0A8X8WJ23_SALSN|nr:hypothetical protein SASPL_145436 [Salvia splendens]